MKQKSASHTSEAVYLNRKEAAKLLRISLQTLYQLCKSGAITPIRLGRRLLFRADVLQSFGKETDEN